MLRILSLPLTVLALAALALSGCGSGQDRASATAKATATVPVDVLKSKQQLDEVLVGLKNMRDASDSADLKKLYADLKTPATKLKQSLFDVGSDSDSAIAAGKEQIGEWHKQANTFTDADLRNASGKRESDLRQAVDQLAASRASLKTISDSYESSVDQALRALDLDLSQPGVQSIKPALAKIVDDEPNLRAALSDVSDKSKAVNALLNSRPRADS